MMSTALHINGATLSQRIGESVKKSLLMVSLTARVAGAERMILQLLPGLRSEYDLRIGLLVRGQEEAGSMPWEGPGTGLLGILFGRADIIHTHLFLPGLLVRFRRLWDGRSRWVHTVHYHDYPAARLPWLKRWLDQRFIFPAPDALVAVSAAVLETIAHHPRSRLIENAIPLERGERPADEAGPPGAAGAPDESDAPVEPDEPDAPGEPDAPDTPGAPGAGGLVLGTVAMLRREKGLEDLLPIVERVRERHPGLLLRIAGDGPLRDRLRERIEERGLAGNVELCGYVTDLDAFYRGLDLYIQPSVDESFGLATLEAMRFGLPIVASDAGNLPRLLRQGEFGAIVPRRGVDASGEPGRFVEDCAAAIERILASREGVEEASAKALAGLAHWRERLDPAAMLAAYRTLYEKLFLPGICMIAPIVTHGTGGLQRQVYLQTRELAERGHRIFILQRRDPRLEKGGRSDASLQEKWRHVQFLGTPGSGIARDSGSPGTRLRGMMFIAFGLLPLVRHRHRIQVLHAHQLYSPTLLGAAAKRLLGKRLVVKVTASGSLGELAQLRELPFPRLRRFAFRQIDRIIVLSDEMMAEMLELGFERDRIELIPNSVALQEEREPTSTRRSPTHAPCPFNLLFCGRLSEEKSIETLIAAAGLLAAEGRPVAVDLVGGADPARDVSNELRSLSEALEGPVEIRFHGNRGDVADFYRRADAFVLPSRSEGMSNALLEALSYGVPCIASDILPNRFLIENGKNGLLFEQGDAAHLASRIALLIDDREEVEGKPVEERPVAGGALSRALSDAALETVRSRFSTEIVGGRLSRLYRELCAPN